MHQTCVSFSFGCGFMSLSTGIIFNKQMNDFSSPEVVNNYGIPSSSVHFIEPGKQTMYVPNYNYGRKRGSCSCNIGGAGESKITLTIGLCKRSILLLLKHYPGFGI